MRGGKLARALVVSALAVLAAGCGSTTPGAGSGNDGALRVVATTTVFADMIENVGGSAVAVTSLVPKGGDVHTFDPTPSAIVAVARADLIFANGLGLDGWLTKVASNASAGAPIVLLGEDLPGADVIVQGGQPNPHLWMDVAYGRLYAKRIAIALERARPSSTATIQAGLASYDAKLATLDAWVRAQIATIPAANRKIVSFHDAFPYYARAYGLEIVGTVVKAPGQDPSAGEIAALIDAIRSSGAKGVFSEAQFNDKLVRTIASEAGATVESNLYDDTIGDPPIDSYIGIIQWDTERVVVALR